APAGTACVLGCSGAGTCSNAGTCNPSFGSYPGVPEDDGDPCTYDYCDFGSGVTSHSPIANCGGEPGLGQDECDDGNPCTYDSLDLRSGCVHSPHGVGAPCTLADRCLKAGACDVSGRCQSTGARAVDDGDPCTADGCDSATGVLTHTPIAGCQRPALP